MANPSASDFGAHLRQAREARGISLRQIATATKISIRALEALERNDPSHLPGGIFTRAFVRAFAKEIGVDPEETVNRFIAAFPQDSGASDRPSAKFAPAESSNDGQRIASTIRLIVIVSAVIGLLVLYLTFRSQ